MYMCYVLMVMLHWVFNPYTFIHFYGIKPNVMFNIIENSIIFNDISILMIRISISALYYLNQNSLLISCL